MAKEIYFTLKSVESWLFDDTVLVTDVIFYSFE